MDTGCQTRRMTPSARASRARSAPVTGSASPRRRPVCPATRRARIDFCVDWLRGRGYEVEVGECMDGTGLTSAPAEQRAAELTRMLADPDIACVVPPWGGETAIDLVDLLDWDALADAEPTWLVGYSDMSTVLLPDHDPARLGDAPRRQPRGHAVRRPGRAAALARPRRRPGPVRAARLRPGGRLGALRDRPARRRSGRTSARAAGRCWAAAASTSPAGSSAAAPRRSPTSPARRTATCGRGPSRWTSPRSSTSRPARSTR